jgi:hypothetical protein
MYADRSSGRKRSVMDRLGSGGGSRSRSDDAKRYAFELVSVQNRCPLSPLPRLLVLHGRGFWDGSIARAWRPRKCCLGASNRTVRVAGAFKACLQRLITVVRRQLCCLYTGSGRLLVYAMLVVDCVNRRI